VKDSIKKGLSFGLTSGIITTLGMIVGLSNLDSKRIIILGIVSVAVADAFSDALGINAAEEAEKKHKNSTKCVWESTISTYLSKVIFASLFILPFLFLSINYALTICLVYSILVIGISSYFIAVQRKENPFSMIFEHLAITAAVIIASHFLGKWIEGLF
jgi:VIT1/CCC1 family predicted Fe2+/Mn2+ transporter